LNFDIEEKPELNITPLVDIMLVLLAILMITTPVIVYEEKISLPVGSKKTSLKDGLKKIVIRVDKNKKIFFQQDNFSFTSFSDSFVMIGKKYDKKTPIFIRADKKLLYDDVIFVLSVIKEAGFSKVSLVTDG
jgi:biopolymer transport protein ExbD